MYIIKQKPEDFIVNEIPLYELNNKGIYSYFWLIKRGYNTVDAVKKIAKMLNIRLKSIGFAGAKDKNAVTKQLISVKSINKEALEKLKIKDITLEYVGNGLVPISLGNLKGNEFVITVRNLKTRITRPKETIPNYFGPQRFSRNNSKIGKALVKQDFKKAASLIDQKELKSHLEEKPADFVGALRRIPLKTRKLYVHAYQSLLWNKTAELYLKTNPCKNIKIPIIGFGTEIEDIKDNDLRKIVQDILKEEGIAEKDFIIPQIKELSSEGGERDLFVKPESLSISIADDELNKGKLKAIVSFFLPKGSYATVVIESIFQSL